MGREPVYSKGGMGGGGTARSVDQIREDVIKVLETVHDPEIPVNIYELGLIYEIKVESGGEVHVRMTLTSPACPVAGSLPGEVEDKIRWIDGVSDVQVELVWDPPWTPDLMSEAARLELNI
jgi:FeS assembly SUF system protein